ncbi:hypothetical protein GJ496_008672 [Pomphorhynchus laevis]|nr:hypothetical protein GJ496_008672 [Pomphorhynchus laevis]
MSRNPFEIDDNENAVEMAKANLEDSMLESTRRAMNMLAESEDVGVQSAVELVEQRQALERIDRKLHQASDTLGETQKNINTLKSTFGGFGSKLLDKISRKKQDSSQVRKEPTNLEKYLQSDLNTVNSNIADKSSAYSSAIGSHASASTLSNLQPNKSSGSAREYEIESNLDDMSAYLSRLKGLAVNMGDELDRQNAFITDIKDTSEKVDSKMTAQREVLQKILKK